MKTQCDDCERIPFSPDGTRRLSFFARADEFLQSKFLLLFRICFGIVRICHWSTFHISFWSLSTSPSKFNLFSHQHVISISFDAHYKVQSHDMWILSASLNLWLAIRCLQKSTFEVLRKEVSQLFGGGSEQRMKTFLSNQIKRSHRAERKDVEDSESTCSVKWEKKGFHCLVDGFANVWNVFTLLLGNPAFDPKTKTLCVGGKKHADFLPSGSQWNVGQGGTIGEDPFTIFHQSHFAIAY